MRAANLENEVSSHLAECTGQHTTAQTFMLEFSGVYSSREQLFQLLGFGALKMCLSYAIR